MSATFPADYDDDHRGPYGRIAYRYRLGAGAELRQLLGLAVVGGLLLSQIVTLSITPVIYLYLDRFSGSGPLRLAEK